MTAYTLTTELCDEGLRLDRFLSEELEDHSRSFLQKLIKEGLVTVDGKPVKANYRLSAGQQVSVQVREPEEVNIEPQEMPLDILYEDGDVCIVNKPKGDGGASGGRTLSGYAGERHHVPLPGQPVRHQRKPAAGHCAPHRQRHHRGSDHL